MCFISISTLLWVFLLLQVTIALSVIGQIIFALYKKQLRNFNVSRKYCNGTKTYCQYYMCILFNSNLMSENMHFSISRMGPGKKRVSCSSCKGQSWQDSGNLLFFLGILRNSLQIQRIKTFFNLILGTFTPLSPSSYSPSQWPAGLSSTFSILEKRQRQKRREKSRMKESCISQLYFYCISRLEH